MENSQDAVQALVPIDTLFVRSKDGSVLEQFNIYRADQLQRAGFYLMVYGGPGAGKTTTAASVADSPYGRPALLLDVDRSSTAISHRDDVEIIYIYKWEDMQLLFKILEGPHKYQAIIIDNLSDLADMCFAYHTRVINSAEPRQHYAAMTASMLTMVKFLRDYAQRINVSLIMTAWEGAEIDAIDGKRKLGIEFNPALQHRIGGLLGSVAYIEYEDTKHTLYLAEHPRKRLITKLRRAPNDVAMTIPLTITNPSLGPIVDTMIGGIPYKSV